MKHFLRYPIMCLLIATPAMAQRGGQQRPTAPTPPATDTNIVKRQGAGFVVNYDDQPLRVVFSALADASGLNIVQTNIPLRNTTLHMGQAVTKEQMLEVIKGIAASNNVTVIEGASLIRLEGPANTQQQNAQQLAQQQSQQAQQQLFIYRLKHASAVQLAPVLQSLFTGLTRTVTTGPQNPIAALLGLGGGQTQTINVGPGGGVSSVDVITTPGRGGNAGGFG